MNRAEITDRAKDIWRKTARMFLTGRAAAARTFEKEGAWERTLTQAKGGAADIYAKISAAVKKIRGDNSPKPPGPNGDDLVSRAEIKQRTRSLFLPLMGLCFLVGFAALPVLGFILSLLTFGGDTSYGYKLILLSVSLPIAFWVLGLINLFGLRSSVAALCILFVIALAVALTINQSYHLGGLWVLFSLVFLPSVILVIVMAVVLYLSERIAARSILFESLTWFMSKFDRILPAYDRILPKIQCMDDKDYKKHWATFLLQISSVGFFFGSLIGYAVSLTFSSPDIVFESDLTGIEHFLYAVRVIAFPWDWWEYAQLHRDMFCCMEEPGCSKFKFIGPRPILWLYILAAQTVYILLLRFPVLCYAGYRFYSELRNDKTLDQETGSPGEGRGLSAEDSGFYSDGSVKR